MEYGLDYRNGMEGLTISRFHNESKQKDLSVNLITFLSNFGTTGPYIISTHILILGGIEFFIGDGKVSLVPSLQSRT